MSMASSIMGMVGSHMQGGAAIGQGIAEEDKARFEAKQMRRNAIAMEAQGQRAAVAERKKGATVSSNAVAQMAAGGGGVDSKFLADIENKADYNALVALYESKSQADVMRDEAKLRISEGKAIKRNARLSAVGSFLQSASSGSSGIASSVGSKGTGSNSADTESSFEETRSFWKSQ